MAQNSKGVIIIPNVITKFALWYYKRLRLKFWKLLATQVIR